MAKNSRNPNAKVSDDLNYFETSGSVSVKPEEANELIDKSLDAMSDNLLKKKVPSSKNTNIL
jgi:hypothetical protein